MRLFRIDSEKRRFGGVWYRVCLRFLWSEGTMECHGVFMCVPLFFGRRINNQSRFFPFTQRSIPLTQRSNIELHTQGTHCPKHFPAGFGPAPPRTDYPSWAWSSKISCPFTRRSFATANFGASPTTCTP
ncbi:unnamed protein product [Pylaiella littoralis]